MAARRAVLAGVLSSVEALVDDSDDVMNVVVFECSEWGVGTVDFCVAAGRVWRIADNDRCYGG